MGRAKDKVNSPRSKNGKFEPEHPPSLRKLRRKKLAMDRRKNK